jgi:LuxR family maltose regulon positive regulatory protein
MLRLAQGRYEQTIDCLRDAERAHERLRSPHFLVTPTTTWQLRARIGLGDTSAARATLTQAGEALLQQPDWCNVGAHLHLAEGNPRAALDALAPVLESPWALHDAHLAIEGLLLEALACERLGQIAAAEQALERALDLADPETLVWIFLTVPAARPLLARHPRDRTTHGPFIGELLGHFARRAGPRGARDAEELGDLLTDRELAVLRFLPTNLSTAEIGDELFVSVHTVSTHVRHIYAKLGVHRRSHAVDRGRTLGLLTGPPQRR